MSGREAKWALLAWYPTPAVNSCVATFAFGGSTLSEDNMPALPVHSEKSFFWDGHGAFGFAVACPTRARAGPRVAAGCSFRSLSVTLLRCDR